MNADEIKLQKFIRELREVARMEPQEHVRTSSSAGLRRRKNRLTNIRTKSTKNQAGDTWSRKLVLSGAVSAPTWVAAPFHTPNPALAILKSPEKYIASLLTVLPNKRRTPGPTPPFVTLLPLDNRNPGYERLPPMRIVSFA